jgi:phospholipid/cholesterol/gamma-HCH transport system substrate-binding protein
MVVVIVVAGAALLLRSRMPKTQMGGEFKTWTQFRDASRLQVGSPVVIAGVRVGDITRLTIDGQFARLDMRMIEGIEIPADSFATRRADSLFGDSYVEIILGGTGSAGPITLLRSGEPIRHVEEGGSTDTTLRTIARTMPKIDNSVDAVHDVMLSGRKWVNGAMAERLTSADRWLSEGRIEGPLSDADRAMERFEERTTNAADAVASAAPNVTKTLDRFDNGITSARKQIADVKVGIVNAMHDAREGFDRADKPLQQMRDVVSAIDEGRGEDWKGTLGRLVNDPGTANTIEDVTGDVAEGAAGLQRFKSYIAGRFELSVLTGSVRAYATAELYARNDKFYLFELERSDLGAAVDSSLSEVAGNANYTRTQEISDGARFTLQFGKRFGHIRFRAGLKDSTVGVGADAFLLEGRLRFSADLFGSFDHTPRLKVAGAYAVFRSLYVLAGVDDALNGPGNLPIRAGNTPVPAQFSSLHYGRDYFVGASLHFDDADLATILRVYGALIFGFLVTD